MSAVEELLRANERYAAQFAKGDLDAAPANEFAVVTCMDARLVPAGALGLGEGDAHVIRNAGGVVTEDVLRSLAISHWELGTQEVVVIAHTRCGLLTLDEDATSSRSATSRRTSARACAACASRRSCRPRSARAG